MQIVDPARLLSLRQRRGLSRPQLAKRSKVTERTIQRLEKEPQPSRKDTLKRLATALGVKPGVLTGEEPLPESVKAPASASKRSSNRSADHAEGPTRLRPHQTPIWRQCH